MGVGSAFMKILSGFLQIFFAIISLGLIIYGAFTAYVIFISNSDEIIKAYGTPIPSLVTIGLGILLLLLVIVGCCGVCRESTGCMETYSGFLILLALSHLALGIYTYIYFQKLAKYETLRNSLDSDLRHRVKSYWHNPQEIDLIQTWFSCCGANNYMEDYQNYGNRELPGSCCRLEQQCFMESEDLNKRGCVENVYNITVYSNKLLGWISLAVGGTELIAALLGLCLSCCFWRNRNASWR